jgi:nitroreductase
MSDTFFTIQTIIQNRRTIKPFMMNGNKIPDEQITELLALADWAPTHGLTEPWRFVVYTEPAAFCYEHAEMYKQNTNADEFAHGVYDNLAHQGDKASHVIIAVMRREIWLRYPRLKNWPLQLARCKIYYWALPL